MRVRSCHIPFLADLVQTIELRLTLVIAAVSCAASSMDYGLAVSLKSWRYQRGRNEQRHLNCVFVA